jgi:curved DNA-binding protein CbpA
MQLKDHYRTLGLEPSASLAEIKKAYRKLAHQFHPDKNSKDSYALAQFSAIKEAYEVLTNPIRKEKYLQQRWYYHSTGRRKTQEILTPLSLLKQVLELDRYVSKLDAHRMGREGLFNHLQQLFSEENIATINSFNEPSINKEIVVFGMRISRFLTHKQVVVLSESWKKLCNDPAIATSIEKQLAQFRRAGMWENYKPIVLILVVILICILIFYLGN